MRDFFLPALASRPSPEGAFDGFPNSAIALRAVSWRGQAATRRPCGVEQCFAVRFVSRAAGFGRKHGVSRETRGPAMPLRRRALKRRALGLNSQVAPKPDVDLCRSQPVTMWKSNFAEVGFEHAKGLLRPRLAPNKSQTSGFGLNTRRSAQLRAKVGFENPLGNGGFQWRRVRITVRHGECGAALASGQNQRRSLRSP